MFRRRIVIARREDAQGQTVRAALEDDFHHFCSEVRAVDGHVQAIRSHAPRRPYTMCDQAAAQLDILIGSPLSSIAHAVTRLTDPTQQCTHLFELTGLAIAAAARGIDRRQYDIEVPTRIGDITYPRLSRDGEPLLKWRVEGTCIVEPVNYIGVDLNAGMARWALSHLSEDEAEAALLMRRCTVISRGRQKNLDANVHARPDGHCFSQQPQRATLALRVVSSTWDFSARPESLCADDLPWLRFEEDTAATLAAL